MSFWPSLHHHNKNLVALCFTLQVVIFFFLNSLSHLHRKLFDNAKSQSSPQSLQLEPCSLSPLIWSLASLSRRSSQSHDQWNGHEQARSHHRAYEWNLPRWTCSHWTTCLQQISYHHFQGPATVASTSQPSRDPPCSCGSMVIWAKNQALMLSWVMFVVMLWIPAWKLTWPKPRKCPRLQGSVGYICLSCIGCRDLYAALSRRLCAAWVCWPIRSLHSVPVPHWTSFTREIFFAPIPRHRHLAR